MGFHSRNDMTESLTCWKQRGGEDADQRIENRCKLNERADETEKSCWEEWRGWFCESRALEKRIQWLVMQRCSQKIEISVQSEPPQTRTGRRIHMLIMTTVQAICELQRWVNRACGTRIPWLKDNPSKRWVIKSKERDDRLRSSTSRSKKKSERKSFAQRS